MTDKDLTRPVPFPLGIADPHGRHAGLVDRAGRLVAIDLERGTVLWRSAEPLRPLAIGKDEVIAFREGDPAVCVALALEGARAGTPLWTSDALPLPAWALARGTELTLATQCRGSTIELAWRARARYRGGAAPGPRILEQANRDAEGTCKVDRASGKASPLSPTAGTLMEPPLEAAAPAPHATMPQRIGKRRYQIVADPDPGSIRTVLRALDADTGALLWEATVDEGPPRAPRPLRQ